MNKDNHNEINTCRNNDIVVGKHKYRNSYMKQRQTRHNEHFSKQGLHTDILKDTETLQHNEKTPYVNDEITQERRTDIPKQIWDEQTTETITDQTTNITADMHTETHTRSMHAITKSRNNGRANERRNKFKNNIES